MMTSAIISFAASASDYNFVTEQPAGELKTYDRAGWAYYVTTDYVRYGAQTGTIDIVFAANNKVWFKNLMSKLETNTWVEGTLSSDGTTITVQLGQAVQFDSEVGQALMLKMFTYDEDDEEFYLTNDTEVKFTIDGDKISLQGTSRYGKVLGLAWAESNEWAGFADVGSVYTPAVTDVPVELPAGISSEVYKFKGTDYIGGTELNYNVNIAFDGNDAYIQGIFGDTPNAWIKGTREGSAIKFPSGQYLGLVATRPYYMLAVKLENTYAIEDLTFTYDETTETLTNTTQYLVLSASKNTVYLTQAISDITITKSKTGSAYEVPYTENFGSSASINDYTIIDGNNDGTTWRYNGMSGNVGYDWSMTNAADEWLITPAIVLEAGKTYIFTLKARSFTASMPERLEVKMGTAATAEAMTVNVIAPTEVATGDLTEFSGSVKATADGNFYFGVHAISDADNMMLVVDDISIVWDEDTPIDPDVTGINAVNAENTDSTIYTLDGRIAGNGNLNQLPKGLYIRGGKKIIVR